jgi:hypothetical protein
MRQQKGFVLVSVLIITTITTMLALAQIQENTLQDRISGNQRKEISARFAAEKGLFDAFEFIKAENAAGTSNEDIKEALKQPPFSTNESYSLENISLSGSNFEFVSKGLYQGAAAQLKTIIEASAGSKGIFDDAIVGCDYVKAWGNSNIDSYNNPNNSETGYYGKTLSDGSINVSANGNVTVLGGDVDLDGGNADLGGSVTVQGTVTASGNITITGSATTAVPPVPNKPSSELGACDPLDIVTEMGNIAAEIATEGPLLSSNTGGNMTLTGTGGSMTLDILGDTDKNVYVFAGLDIGSQTITIDGDVIIYIINANNFTTSGSTFQLANPDSSLTIFTTGKVAIESNSDIFSEGYVNANGEAPLTLYSTNTSVGNNKDAAVYLKGNAEVYMNLYAPFGEVNYQGGSGLFGAVRGKKVNITGNGSIHYDEGLGAIGNSGGSAAKTSYASVYYYYPE